MKNKKYFYKEAAIKIKATMSNRLRSITYLHN
jgi:hypothetical protein